MSSRIRELPVVWWVAAHLLACAAASLGSCDGRPSPEGTRIVLITIDTLRFDDFMGADERPSAMPLTRAYAGRGLLFENSFSATSTTQPSHASLLTGLHPWQHGVTRNGHLLDEGIETVAEHLRTAGFSTQAVVSSFPLERRFGFAQGFDRYVDVFDRSIERDRWQGQELEGQRFYALANATTEQALAALDQEQATDQFLWVHYFDPHNPYGDGSPDGEELGSAAAPWSTVEQLRSAAERQDPQLPQLVARARESYVRDLGFLDACLARLLAQLEAGAARLATHVVITADHGESFGEDGSFGHGTRLTRSQIQVPLAIVSPRVGARQRQDAAGSIDVFATLLDLGGLAAPPGRGRSLLAPPDEGGGSAFGMRRTFRNPRIDRRSDGTARLITEPSYYAFRDGRLLTGGPDGTIFASPGGPLEDPALVRAMHGLFGGFAAELEGRPERALEEAEVLDALEALGYTR